MSLSGKERRTLADIEHGLAMEDPDFARRIAAINMIESGGEPALKASGERLLTWARHRMWVIGLAVVIAIALLVLAIATA
ncbi:DUF3040 domain-containing protein [Nonomuraea sediminis]|uniref:DUF3040 domain-containing protein n=1 Tax=Nonomuraea sediminis TaxID=2835864 RepID=UPI001BDBB90A|nr:DUF3040 domain-containing protein [Nonomuraea sediminis]